MSFSSTVPLAKSALITVLDARSNLASVKVRREVPEDPADIRRDDGIGEAIWIGGTDDAGISQDVDGRAEVNIFTGGVLRFDEEYTLRVTVQTLGADTADDQKDMTDRAYELAAEIIGAISSDPTLGVAESSTVSLFRVVSYTWDERCGVYAQSNSFGCRLELGLSIEARVTLT